MLKGWYEEINWNAILDKFFYRTSLYSKRKHLVQNISAQWVHGDPRIAEDESVSMCNLPVIRMTMALMVRKYLITYPHEQMDQTVY